MPAGTGYGRLADGRATLRRRARPGSAAAYLGTGRHRPSGIHPRSVDGSCIRDETAAVSRRYVQDLVQPGHLDEPPDDGSGVTQLNLAVLSRRVREQRDTRAVHVRQLPDFEHDPLVMAAEHRLDGRSELR